MTTADTAPLSYPFNVPESLELSDEYEQARNRPGLLKVRMTYGEPAWLVTRYAEARFVLGDRRFSRAEGALHDEPRQSEGRRDSGILGMDPPDHTRLRTLVAKAFTVRQVEKLRPQVKQLAQRAARRAGGGRAAGRPGGPLRAAHPRRRDLPAARVCRPRTGRGSGCGAMPRCRQVP